jgi:glycosyltransferase involved in cell wall biosynthesis
VKGEISKICYFGIYPPTAPRDKVYFDGLRDRGVNIIECVDKSGAIFKYFRLISKLRKLKSDYDILWIGYLQASLVPLARIFSRKTIIYNAPFSMYETYILDREVISRYSPRAWFIWFLDFLAFHLADICLLESQSQKSFVSEKFYVKHGKLHSIFSGADTKIFFPDPAVKKTDTFTVLFRGMFIPGTGVEYVLEAAEILKKENINFLVIGWGQDLEMVKERVGNLPRVELIETFLPAAELRKRMLQCHVMLGQFSSNKRMDRTIQHKNIEAMALGMPFITRDSISNRELLEDEKNCLFVKPANARELAKAILRLRDDKNLRDKLSLGALENCEKKLSAKALAEQVLAII